MVSTVVAYLNFHIFAALLNGLALGSMIFFAAIVTPSVFKALEGEHRSRYLETIFPLYFRAMAGLEAIAGILIIYRIEGWALLAVAAAFMFSDQALRPTINRLRAGHYAGDADTSVRFKKMHRLSVLINLAQIFISLIVFFRLAV